MPSVLFEKIPGVGITEDFIEQAAELFSSSYGVWNTHVKGGVDYSSQAGNMELYLHPSIDTRN
jgi:hypothetical protein